MIDWMRLPGMTATESVDDFLPHGEGGEGERVSRSHGYLKRTES